MTERNVQGLAKRGIVVPAEDRGRYMLLRSAQNYIKFLGNADRATKSSAAIKHEEETKKYQAKIHKIRAEKAQREDDLETGRALPREETIIVWQRHIQRCRARCKRWLQDLKSEIRDLEPSVANRMDSEFNQFFAQLGSEVPQSYKKPIAKKRAKPRKKATPVPKMDPETEVLKKKAKTKKKAAAKKKSKAKRSTKKTTIRRVPKKKATAK